MVNITRVDGQFEDVSNEEEERDEHGNLKFDPTRLNLEGQSKTPSEQRHHPNTTT